MAPPRRHWRVRAVMLFLFTVLIAALAAGAVAKLDVPPRELAPYLQHRAAGNHPLLVRAMDRIASVLMELDRGDVRAPPDTRWRWSPRATDAVLSVPAEPTTHVDSVARALEAFANARPGDVLEFEPGTYRFERDHAIRIDRPGAPGARITVRAARPGSVVLELESENGFLVSAPYWTFENLIVRGTCARHDDCEHAFHVVGAAHDFILRNNRLEDFNAHIKVNGDRRTFPDGGLIEGNSLTDSAARQTASPVTPLDLVAASGWTVRDNFIADFVKAQGDRISYGAFAKGGGTDNRFERNIVACEWRLRGAAGWRVGLSLGGGGTDTPLEFCRDRTCVIEQDGGVIESNLIASCSDDGIYVNRGANSRIVHNTLVDTGGILVRFPQSAAEVSGNLVDGTIRGRDGALLRAADNRDGDMASLYVGLHPLRALFRDPVALDFAWLASPPRRRAPSLAGTKDLCGVSRSAGPVYGAFEDFSACLEGSASPLHRP